MVCGVIRDHTALPYYQPECIKLELCARGVPGKSEITPDELANEMKQAVKILEFQGK